MPYAADMLLPLAQNISLFVVFAAAFSAIRNRLGARSPLVAQGTAGVIFGLIALLTMASPFVLSHGVYLDGRNVVIAVGTAMAGPVAGAICLVFATVFRWSLGGIGLQAALVGMAGAWVIACLFRRWHQSRNKRPSLLGLMTLGILTGLSTFTGYFLIPDAELAREMFQTSALPMMMLAPVGTVLAGALMLWENQRESLQTELRTSRQRLELALKGSQDGVFDYGVRSQKVWTSHRYREMRGYESAPEITDLAFWRALVIEDDRPRVGQAFADLEAGRVDRVDVLMRVRHRNGRIIHVRSQAVSERDASGKVLRIVGSNADETQRVQAETRLRNAIDSMESGFAYFDADDRLVLCNDGFIDPGTRARFSDPVGLTFEEIMRPFAFDEFTAASALPDPESWLQWRLEQHRNPPARPLEIQWTDGRWFSVLEHRTSDGGCVGLWTDITAQKRRQAELEESREQLQRQTTELAKLAERLEQAKRDADRARYFAERADREKSSFLASMSHELRTPLNAIIGFTDMMRTEAFGPVSPPKYAEYVRIIGDSGEHLLSLINDVLDLSKIEAGGMKLTVEVLSVHEICDQAVGLMRELAAARSVNLIGAVEDDCAILHGDERAVKQMLLNMVSNAVKFTGAGGSVRLDVAANAEGAVLTVRDTGIGMTEAELKVAVEPYGQVDSRLARKTVGTGLGLPLIKRLAELHGGKFSISSARGVGTTVTVLLPWKRDLPPQALPARTARVR
jgi:PAS domain S-box-containing protein